MNAPVMLLPVFSACPLRGSPRPFLSWSPLTGSVRTTYAAEYRHSYDPLTPQLQPHIPNYNHTPPTTTTHATKKRPRLRETPRQVFARAPSRGVSRRRLQLSRSE